MLAASEDRKLPPEMLLFPVHQSSDTYLAKNYIPYIKIIYGGNIKCVFSNYKVHEFSIRNKFSADRCMEFGGVFTARISKGVKWR